MVIIKLSPLDNFFIFKFLIKKFYIQIINKVLKIIYKNLKNLKIEKWRVFPLGFEFIELRMLQEQNILIMEIIWVNIIHN